MHNHPPGALAVLAICSAALAQDAGDCDRNGLPDALELRITLAFDSPVDHAVGEIPHVIEAADLDGDSDLDLVTSDRAADTLSVLANDGRGGFTLGQTLATADEPRGIDAGDVDGDGDLDLLSGNGEEHDAGDLPTNSLLLNTGAGFAARTDLAAHEARAGALRATWLADVDGDGRLDIVNGFSTSESGGVVTILLQAGPAFEPPRAITAASPGFASLRSAQYVAVGDVTGDGQPDVVTFAGQVLAGTTDGGLAPPADFAPGTSPRGIALADLDGDGDRDVLLTRTDSVPVTLGALAAFEQADGELRSFGDETEVGALLQTGLGAADLDQDGAVDVALALNDSHAAVLLGDGAGRFATLGERFPLGESFPRWIAAADLNGDARPDIACPKQVGTVAVILNLLGRDADRDGVLDTCEARPFFRGDADSDGRLDLTDAIATLLHLFQGVTAPACLEAADANDDGALDIADALTVLRYLYQGGGAPPPPGPPAAGCSRATGRTPFLGCTRGAECE
jgi:hypothetical protein